MRLGNRVREGGPSVQREPRIVVACRVDFTLDGEVVSGVSQDVSQNGVFVRTDRLMSPGDVVELTLHLPNAGMLAVEARAVHVLSDIAARALGRLPGVGFFFVDSDATRRAELDAYLDEIVAKFSVRPEPEPRSTRILVADGSTRLLERLSFSLGNAGFVVSTAANGAEAYAGCLHDPPDLVLAAADMPVVDGWRLVGMLGSRPILAQIPVALMSEQADDITRLRAYRLGVMDFVPKPFTVAEICIRMRRLARAQVATPDRVMLRGSLAEIGVATLLSLLEFERKSGILTVTTDVDVTWLSVDSGRVVKVESASHDAADSRANLMRVLDWNGGQFEFVSCQVFDDDEIGLSTTHLLLEHARRIDEKSGRAARTSDA